MLRLALAVLMGLVGAAIVHIAVIFTMPQVAENDAWGRLQRLGSMFEVVRIDALRSRANGPVAQAEGSALHDFAFVDPAFVTVGCRFSVAEGPVRLTADGAVDFWSASVYSRRGDNVYSINDRSAVAGQFDLLVGTPEQLVDAQAASTDPGETVIPVEVDIDEGYLTLRALVDEESERPSVDAFMRSVTCATADPAAG